MINRNRKGQYQFNYSHTNWSGLIFLLLTILCAKSLEYAYSTPEPYEMLVPGYVMAVEPSPALDRTTQLSPTPSPTPTPTPKPTKARVEPQTEVERMIYQYFPEDYEKALAIAKCESSLNPKAYNDKNSNGSWDAGLFQINSVHGYTVNHLMDLENNVKIARKIYDRQGWKPWVCSRKLND